MRSGPCLPIQIVSRLIEYYKESRNGDKIKVINVDSTDALLIVSENTKDGEILIEEDPTLFALPSTALDMQALPYFPPVTTPLPVYKHIPSVAPRSAPYIPFLVPFLYNHPSITPPTSNNNSTCVPAIPVDEPNTLYLLAIGLLLRIFIKHD